MTAVDPSAGMVQQAQRLTADPKITIRQAGAEDLSFLPDASVDLAVAGQAAHWFDYQRTWPELARVVRKGGAIAFWGYKDNIIVGYPQLVPIYHRFVYGSEQVRPGIEGMGRFWENPGRTVLKESFAAIIPPHENWDDCNENQLGGRRVVYWGNRESGGRGAVVEEDTEARSVRRVCENVQFVQQLEGG